MATYQLTDTQLISFLEYTWNRHLPKWHQNLFSSILEFEENREFSEGWDYCESKLEISIVAAKGYHYEWTYTTTSGTEIKVINSSYDKLLKVTIPDHRDKPGRTAHTDMQAVLAGHSYWSWEEQQDETNPDAIAAAAFFAGTTVEELIATRKKEEEEREKEKAKRRQFYQLNPEGDYEEFDEDAYG